MPLSYVRFLVHRRFRIVLLLHVYFERVFSYWRRLFWKGALCFECAEVRGAGSRNEGCRLSATGDRLRNLQGCPPSMLLLYKGKIVTQSGQSIYFVCILHPPSNPQIILWTYRHGCWYIPGTYVEIYTFCTGKKHIYLELGTPIEYNSTPPLHFYHYFLFCATGWFRLNAQNCVPD